MVSANTLCKNVLNVKNTVIENFNLYSDEDGVKHIRIKARHHFYIKYSFHYFIGFGYQNRKDIVFIFLIKRRMKATDLDEKRLKNVEKIVRGTKSDAFHEKDGLFDGKTKDR